MNNMTAYEGQDRREREYSNVNHPFYFKPVFTLTSIITILAAGLAVVLYITDMHTDIAVLENNMENVEQTQAENNVEWKGALKEVNVKLDRLLERVLIGSRQ